MCAEKSMQSLRNDSEPSVKGCAKSEAHCAQSAKTRQPLIQQHNREFQDQEPFSSLLSLAGVMLNVNTHITHFEKWFDDRTLVYYRHFYITFTYCHSFGIRMSQFFILQMNKENIIFQLQNVNAIYL